MNFNKSSLLADFTALDATNPSACDALFEKYGVGNTLDIKDRPFERLNSYLFLIDTLRTANSTKYHKMHKGTPFYFIGWLAFDIRNYPVANFYIAAAVVEDRRNSANWINGPAAGNLLLDGNTNTSAKRIVETLTIKVEDELRIFSRDTTESISLSNFTGKFIKPLLQGRQYSLVTGLYSWVLEFEENYKSLLLAGTGGSKETILTHLFKGCLLFETLLKHYYPDPGATGKEDGRTLGNLFHDNRFLSDFSLVAAPDTRANLLQDIVNASTALDTNTVFSNTARLRNTTGHKIIWDNPFTSPDVYEKLYKQIATALLYVVAKKV